MPLPNANGTLLVLSVMGVPFYSARGLSQSITPIKQSEQQEYDVNGNLLDMSYAQFRKYSTVISCKDMRVPAIGGIWPGQVIQMQCVAELSYPVGGSPERPVVTGSSRTNNGFVFYRPIFNVMIGSWDLTHEEYPDDVQWAMPFLEV